VSLTGERDTGGHNEGGASNRSNQSGPGQTTTGTQRTQGLQNKTQNKTETLDHILYNNNNHI